jgi:Tfp pilus assembly protein PilF
LKLQQAIALHQRGQLSGAKRLDEEILSEQPQNFDALHLLGVIVAVSGDPKKAADLIGRAIQIDSRCGTAHNNRGAALQQLGDWQGVLAEFERAI